MEAQWGVQWWRGGACGSCGGGWKERETGVIGNWKREIWLGVINGSGV